jgi:[acyl-carrier-protein] S-malonyltransferase
LTASIAALKVFEARYHGIKPSFVAGLSLGEYSALVAGGVMDFKDVLYLVRKRGEFMEAAAKKNPGKMSCILGLEREVLLAICEKTGCEIANLNCPGQIVISGKRAQLEEAGLLATAKGAERVIPLDVSGAFHCSLMNEASAQLKKEIEKVKFQRPQVPLVSNVDALEQTDPAVIKKNLIKQVDSATYWEESMRYLMARGIDLYFEIGPGSVLKGLFKKIDPNIKVITVGKWDEIEGLKDHPAFATCPRP